MEAFYSVYLLYLFSKVVITKYYKLGGFHNGNLLSHGSGDMKLKLRVSPSLVPWLVKASP